MENEGKCSHSVGATLYPLRFTNLKLIAQNNSKNMEGHHKRINKHLAADLGRDNLRWLEILQDLKSWYLHIVFKQESFQSSLPITSPSTPYNLIDVKRPLTIRMCQQNSYYLIDVFITLTSLLNLKGLHKDIQFKKIEH